MILFLKSKYCYINILDTIALHLNKILMLSSIKINFLVLHHYQKKIAKEEKFG